MQRPDLQKYAYQEEAKEETPRDIKVVSKVTKIITKTRKQAKKRPKSKPKPQYPHLEEIPDLLSPGLRLVFCGFNPGIQSALTGHRYAHVTNLFWRLLVELKLVAGLLAVDSVQDCDLFSAQLTSDKVLTKEQSLKLIKNLTFKNSDQFLFLHYNIGFTDLVARPTKNIAELDSKELDDGSPLFLEKLITYKPRIVCFIGKEIFVRIYKHLAKSTNNRASTLLNKEFQWGKQNTMPYFELFKNYFLHQYVPVIHVFPSTSGLVGSVSRQDKLRLFVELKKDLLFFESL